MLACEFTLLICFIRLGNGMWIWMPLVSKGGLSFSSLRSSDGWVPHSGMQRNSPHVLCEREREREKDWWNSEFCCQWQWGLNLGTASLIEAFHIELGLKELKLETDKGLGGVWFVFSNNYFQFLNNILRIFIYFFTRTYFYKYF